MLLAQRGPQLAEYLNGGPASAFYAFGDDAGAAGSKHGAKLDGFLRHLGSRSVAELLVPPRAICKGFSRAA